MAAAIAQGEVISALEAADPAVKCEVVAALWARAGAGFDATDFRALKQATEPGRPARPQLVAPARLARRRLGGEAGRAALVHAIAHIEFNAINLALDAAARFGGMPQDFHLDWLSVAADEARHFALLEERLHAMGHAYGDFPAHDGLWEMAMRTRESCLERMALVPRVLEARGLDVTPGMIERLRRAGDGDTIAVLEVILAEEVRHVAIGSHWFRYCCERAGCEPEATFMSLLERYGGGFLRGPFNDDARLSAGFTQQELDWLKRREAVS